MELDSRILEGKKPLDCFDAEQARNFVGKKCYLTNDISLFSDLDVFKDIEGCKSAPNEYDGIINTLSDIDTEISMVFETTYLRWKFCIPCEWVKQPEKKYRPYTLAEWINQHEIGEVIHYRDKDYKQQFHVMYSGYIIDEGEDIQDIRTTGRIMLIYTGYFLENLFEDYEICINGEWQPFGIKE